MFGKKKPTSFEIASSYKLWVKHFDRSKTITEYQFNELTITEKQDCIEKIKGK